MNSLKSWVPMMGLILLVGILTSSPVLIALGIAMGVIYGISAYWKKHAFDGVSYRRRWVYRHGFPGEKTTFRIEVENRKLLPLTWLSIRDPWPKAVGPEDETILRQTHLREMGTLAHLFSLRWYERTQRQYTLVFRKRGYYSVGPAELESGDFFGLLDESRQQTQVEHLTVFPEILTLPELQLQSENPFGDQTTRRRIFEDPNRPVGVRDYRPEDDFRRIHWPATAHTGAVQVKVYETVTSQVMTICLNVTTLPHYWEGISEPLLEQLVKVAATMVVQGIKSGYSVGLISNGCLQQADQPFKISPGRSNKHQVKLLQALAGVSPFTTAPFERFLLKSVPGIPYGATLVLISAWITPELIETLMRLRRYRPHMTLAFVSAQVPPVIPGVKTIHIPYYEDRV